MRAIAGAVAGLLVPLNRASARRPAHYVGAPAYSVPGYRPDIDGLRAIAVLPVLLFHFGVPGVPGGFVGVDIFFVISGFVIARGLIADLDAGSFSLGNFYERRVRRLLPALLAVLAATTVVAWIVLLPPALIHYSQSLAASAASAANLFLWVGSGYFAPEARQVPLMHLWSLAVEEQFYLLFPVLLAIGYRRFPGSCRPVALAVALASFALSVALLPAAPAATFFLLPTRLWELMLGVLLALYRLPAGPAWLARMLAVAGIAMIGWPILLYTELTPFPGFAALPPALGAAALIHAGASQTGEGRPPRISRWLGCAPMVLIGRLSYPLYLVHWPVVTLTRELTMREPDAATIGAMLAGCIFLAWSIERWIERPLRYAAADRRTVLRLAALGLLLAALVGAAGVATRGAPARFALPPAQQLGTEASWGSGTCFFEGGADPLSWREADCVHSRGGRKVLLWGDSFAAHYVPGIRANAADIDATIVQYTAAACVPMLDTSGMTPSCRAFNEHVLDVVSRGGYDHVILAARWQNHEALGFDALPATIAALRRTGVGVTVIGQTPIFAADVQTIAFRAGARPVDTAEWPATFHGRLNDALRAASGGAQFVDPVAILCTGRSCRYKVGPAFLFADFGHFSAEGSRRAVARLFPFVRDAAPGPTPP